MGGLFSGGGITILNFFLLLLFGVTLENPYVLITEALQIAGIWKILEKSGNKTVGLYPMFTIGIHPR